VLIALGITAAVYRTAARPPLDYVVHRCDAVRGWFRPAGGASSSAGFYGSP
jgi:hypothetical protein